MLKKFLSIILALFLIFSLTLPLFSAYQTTNYHMSSDNLTLHTDNNGTYMISCSGAKCHVEKLSPDTYGADLQLDLPISAISVFDDTIVALCNDIRNDQLCVYTYRADTDLLNSFVIADICMSVNCGFFYDGGSVFFTPSDRFYVLEQYSSSGKRLNRFTFNNRVTQVGADYHGNIFAVCSDNTLYRMNGNRFTAIGVDPVAVPITFFDNRLFTDASGRVFEISNNSCRFLFTANTDISRHHPCVLDSTVYYPDGAHIYGYDINSCVKQSKYTLGDTVLGLYADNGYVHAICNDGMPTVSRIRLDEFTDLIRESPQHKEQHDPYSHGDSDTSQGDSSITSDVYRIDFDSYSISKIPSGTTLAQLKKNISCDGFEVRFYRNGSLKKSGKCGTAMTAVFDSDRAQYTFELSVIGDITGEGNVNSRDLTLFMEYLLGTADFNGVYITSADLSEDGVPDVKDLAMLHRMYE